MQAPRTRVKALWWLASLAVGLLAIRHLGGVCVCAMCVCVCVRAAKKSMHETHEVFPLRGDLFFALKIPPLSTFENTTGRYTSFQFVFRSPPGASSRDKRYACRGRNMRGSPPPPLLLPTS